MSNRKGYKKRGSSYSKKKRFMRSQKAHLRLFGVHTRKYNRVKRYYHEDCYRKQEQLGRILTRAERKKLYTQCSQAYPAPKRNNPYDDFVYTPWGSIKGSYTADGFFEPD